MIISKNIAPLRNFHYLNENNPKWFVFILLNPIFRKLIHNLLNKLSFFRFFKKIKKRFKNKLFIYPIIFTKRNRIYFLDYGMNARPSLILKPNKILTLKKRIHDEEKICFGIGFLETLKFINNVNKYDLLVSINIYDEDKILLDELKFALPIGKKKHALSKNEIGSSWYDFSINLKKYKNKLVIFEILLSLDNKSFVFRKSNQEITKNKTDIDLNLFALSKPFYKKKNAEKKILLLAGESLTDPKYIKKFYNKNLILKNFSKLSDIGNSIEKSYSVADSTLPNIPSMLTGLLPSQHGFGDYKLPIYNKTLNKNIKTIPELIKKNFLSSVVNCYPRFDHLYGWGRKVNNYFNTNGPWNDYSPDSKKIIENFEYYKGTNTFIYAHIDKLHLPSLHNAKKNYFEIKSAESLSSSFQNKFIDHYCEQLEKFDLELGIIIDYLENTNQYKNTKIILTGDHGIAMPPKWKTDGFKGMEFAHYDEHSRVPLIIKNAEWEDAKFLQLEQTGAQYFIFKNILESLNLDLPNYCRNLPQFEHLKNMAISETVYHPEKNNYSVCLNFKDTKFWKMMEVNWKDKVLIKNLKTKIFLDEEELTNGQSLNEEVVNKMNSYCNEFLKTGLEFQKKYN